MPEEKILIACNKAISYRFVMIILLLHSITLTAIGIFIKIHRFAYGVFFFVALSVPIATMLLWLISLKNELMVTNQRIIGRTLFKKYICIPIDSVYTAGTGFLWGVVLKTSCGSMHFKFIKNNTDIPPIISRILIERREQNT